jgi:N-acetylglucosamine-6-phosphate deacetylase
LPITGSIPGFGAVRVEISGGTIRAVEPAAPDETWLAPGLIDIQLNGFAGVDFSDPHLEPEQAASVLPALWRTGVTTFCPTLITNTMDALARAFRTLEAARCASPAFAHAVPCYHLEGPWISPGPSHGVHNPEWMHAPDWDEFCRLQQAAGGRIGIVTLAPEWPGAPEFIARVVQAGVIVAVGHTDGAPDDIHRAAAAGATLATHLGNGCPGMVQRHANTLWPQLTDDRLHASIICDGFHLPPDFVRVALRAKGIERLILITDAVHVAGLAPGRYLLAGTDIELLPSGKVVKVGDTCLGGSAASMDRVVSMFMQMTEAGLAAAIRAATANPARLLGRPGICPAITPARPANLVRFVLRDGAMKVESVYSAGKEVYA